MTHVAVRIPFGRHPREAMYFYVAFQEPKTAGLTVPVDHRYDWDPTNHVWVRSDW